MSDQPDEHTEDPAGDDAPTSPPHRHEAETVMGSIRALHGADAGMRIDLEGADEAGVSPQREAPTGERYA